MYEQLIADGLRWLGVRLFNIGQYLPSPAKGSVRRDNTERLKKLHSDSRTKEMMLRGVKARAERIKGTEEAVRFATHASHSRTPKPLSERKSKPRELCLRKGTLEHSAMLSKLLRQAYAEGKRKPRYEGKKVMRLDTGQHYISGAEMAKALGVTKQAIFYQLDRGSGVCKSVPIAYVKE